MRRNWLAKAALTAVALSVPMAGAASNAQAATSGGIGQQKAIYHKAQPKKKARSHRASKPKPKVQLDAYYQGKHRASFNQKAATYVKAMEGVPYRYGGTTPAGFDCSGLTQYIYRHYGKRIKRTAEDQFLESRRISKKRAWGGDLVFFHVDSNPNSYVYHVGIYEGRDDMVAATSAGSDVKWQNFSWAGDTVTFGTFTH